MASSTITASILVIFAFFASPSAAGKVSLTLYYESLCPGCTDFIINDLAKIFDNGLIDIVDLKLVPWGNAYVRANSTFDCQHGPSECLLNTIEACAIHVWPQVTEQFSVIKCVETLVHDGKYLQWETCLPKLGLDGAAILSCYSNGIGKVLELEYAAETQSLVPPHTYVPWVVVDGKPLYEKFDDLVSYVCKAYTGTSLPSACNNASLISILREEPNKKASPVCYLEKETTQSKPTPLKEH